MAEGKYDKYFIEYDPGWFPKEHRPVMARMQDSITKMDCSVWPDEGYKIPA